MATTKEWEVIYNEYMEMYKFFCPNNEAVTDTHRPKGTSEEWKKKAQEYHDNNNIWRTSGNTIYKMSLIQINIRDKVNNPRK